jgi:BirA family biotin operon repressor/biotin-[acetyl-CoA-carboxylase] ligase
MNQPSTSRWADAARPGARIGHEVEGHATIGSTNDRARALLAAGRDGVAVVADEQTAGRGRHGRSWLTPPGRGLALSVGVRTALAARDGWQLALAAGLAARDACHAGEAIGLKWPNDLVAEDGRKVGGILVETTVAGDRIASFVFGNGLNLDWPAAEMPADLVATAASLGEVLGRPVDRVELLGRLLAALQVELAAVERGRSPVERYRAACATLGRDVRVETAGRVVEGRAVGIGEHGALLVESAEGTVALDAGEVVRTRAAVPA